MADENPIAVRSLHGNNAALAINLSVGEGTLTLATVAGLTFSAGTGTSNANMSFTGSVAI